jgi:hypothetical protein
MEYFMRIKFLKNDKCNKKHNLLNMLLRKTKTKIKINLIIIIIICLTYMYVCIFVNIANIIKPNNLYIC